MNSMMIKETARVWQIPRKRVKALADWCYDNVPKERRGIAFTTLLRKYQGSNKKVKQ